MYHFGLVTHNPEKFTKKILLKYVDQKKTKSDKEVL